MKSCLLITLLLFLNNSFAQSDFEKESFQNAEYVFHGKMLGINYIKDTNDVWVSVFKMLVIKELKTNQFKKPDTVELVTRLSEEMTTLTYPDGRIEFIHAPSQHPIPRQRLNGISLRHPVEVIILARKNNTIVKTKSNYLSLLPICNNNNCYYLIYTKGMAPEIISDNPIKKIEGFNKVYLSVDEFNKTLKKMKLLPLIETKKKHKCFLKKNK